MRKAVDVSNGGRGAVLLLCCAMAMLSACNGGVSGVSSVPQASQSERTAAVGSAGQYIKHIFIIVQENRSFVDLFSGFPNADAPAYGYLGTQKVTLSPVPLEDPEELHNRWPYAIADWDNGKMDAFGQESPPTYAYAFVPRAESQPYWALASRYVLADRMFATEFGPSFTAHMDLIDGNTTLTPGKLAEADYPANWVWGCNASPGTITYTVNNYRQESANGPFPCFTQVRTMADTLDAAHVTWRYYTPSVSGSGLPVSTMWTAFAAIKNVYDGPDWSNIVSPENRVLTDVNKAHFPNVVWIMPDWVNSDHPGNKSDTGPSWVASIVNAIGHSPYWSNSAIIILWDDWGGWYDDAPPPQLNFLGLGMRVPCIIVSPYAKRGYVSHTRYEFGSILKFVEEAFNLPPLGPKSQGYTDSRATSIMDSFNFTQTPRRFKPIPAKYPESLFLHQRPSMRAPDEY